MSYILHVPEIALEKIFSFLTCDEIAKNRIICRKFNEVGGRLLTRNFAQLERRHATIHKRVKAALPRRESERRAHPFARHSDILQAVETRISMLTMTYTKYIEAGLVCFIPGKVLDEMRHVLNLVEREVTPPRTHQLLQELRDLSSMAMEHFDEHILPKMKEKLEKRQGSPEKLLKELEVVAGSLVPYSRGKASTSRSSRLLLSHQVQQVLSNELRKVKKQSKTHKHHLSFLSQSTHKLSIRLRKQNLRLKAQSAKIREQERKIQEQNTKIQEQEATLADIKKHMDEWDQKYKDLTTELVRARDEILIKATAVHASPTTSSSVSPPKIFKSNIKPRAAHILPKNYLQLDIDRKRKSNLLPDIPVKRNRSPALEEINNKKNIENIELNLPEIKLPDMQEYKDSGGGGTKENTEKDDNESGETRNSVFPSSITNSLETYLMSPFTSLSSLKSRKRKMHEDIDLK